MLQVIQELTQNLYTLEQNAERLRRTDIIELVKRHCVNLVNADISKIPNTINYLEGLEQYIHLVQGAVRILFGVYDTESDPDVRPTF